MLMYSALTKHTPSTSTAGPHRTAIRVARIASLAIVLVAAGAHPIVDAVLSPLGKAELVGATAIHDVVKRGSELGVLSELSKCTGHCGIYAGEKPFVVVRWIGRYTYWRWALLLQQWQPSEC
jgi:hypothetical protein